MTKTQVFHQPVLLAKLMQMLDFSGESVVVDATVGQAGHARACAERLGHKGVLIGLDVDQDGLAVAGIRLRDLSCKVHLVRENFGRLDRVIREVGIEQVEVIIADLGVSSAQLADKEKGLSFQLDGPLDMRLDDRKRKTARELVNGLSETELADLVWEYGQERHSRRIARAIVAARKKKPLETTGELAATINKGLGIRGKGRKSRIHPATRTFQALRICVNEELQNLRRLLELAPGLLKPAGQIAVISYHSLEDRLVKHNFRDNHKQGRYEIQTPKPVQPDEQERRRNPRSRSAKLRIARRTDKD